jgi:hypothetical protein
MGLDMYLNGRKYFNTFTPDGKEIKRDIHDGFEVEALELRIGYWRKHAPLHTFIVNEIHGGEDDCRPIELNEDELLEIADALRKDRLSEYKDCVGCFFGSQEIWDEYKQQAEEDAKIFEKAAAWLKQNPFWNTVVYTASW